MQRYLTLKRGNFDAEEQHSNSTVTNLCHAFGSRVSRNYAPPSHRVVPSLYSNIPSVLYYREGQEVQPSAQSG